MPAYAGEGKKMPFPKSGTIAETTWQRIKNTAFTKSKNL